MPTKPTQLRIPPDLLEIIDGAAKAAGLSRTTWLIEAAKDRLARDPRDGGIIDDINRDLPAAIKQMDAIRAERREDVSGPARFACPVCGLRYAKQIRCPCSNRLAQ